MALTQAARRRNRIEILSDKGKTMADQKTSIKDVLEGLAPLAKEGIRAFVIIGKAKDRAKKSVKEGTGEITLKQEVICGEGESIKLKFGENDPTPGIGYEGAFLVANPVTYQGYKSCDCIGFA